MSVTVEEAAGPQNPARKPPALVIVGADKGGVGKTTIARAFADYAGAQRVVLESFDTEPAPGVLRRFVRRAEQVDADTVPGLMRIVDSALSGGSRVTLVDCRAGILGRLLAGLSRISLIDDVRAGALRLLVLHVVGSSVASSSEIPAVISAVNGASLVRVNNRINPAAAFALPVTGEVTIEVPYLDEVAAAAVDQADQGFRAFADDHENSRVLRGYVRAWLHDVHAELDRAGVGAMIRPD